MREFPKPPIGSMWKFASKEAILFTNPAVGMRDLADDTYVPGGTTVVIMSKPNDDERVRVLVDGRSGWMNSAWFCNTGACAYEVKT